MIKYAEEWRAMQGFVMDCDHGVPHRHLDLPWSAHEARALAERYLRYAKMCDSLLAEIQSAPSEGKAE